MAVYFTILRLQLHKGFNAYLHDDCILIMKRSRNISHIVSLMNVLVYTNLFVSSF